MTESLHPQDQTDVTGNVEPIFDETLDPTELGRHELLEQFLSQCRHSNLRSSEHVADFIVSTLRSGPDQAWGYALQQLKIDTLEYSDSYLNEHREQDEIFSHIFDLLLATKLASRRKEGLTIERKALLELLDLRAGITAQFDRGLLTSERNESGWIEVLDRIVPPKS